MGETLLERHLGKRQGYWIHDAYEDSMTPLGEDEFWYITLLPGGGNGIFEIQIDHPYTNELISHVRIEGPWQVIEATEEYYLVVLKDVKRTLIAGDSRYLHYSVWGARSDHRFTLHVTEKSINGLQDKR
ncbi:MAG: hypothetical protein HC822_16875 [Oscillochloris sp.]|nr:hypothetical protein [Oscillochloris sp.]